MASKVGGIIRHAREAKGLSQRELSALAEVSEKQLHNVERGANTSIDFLERVARVLGVQFTIGELATANPQVDRAKRLVDGLNVGGESATIELLATLTSIVVHAAELSATRRSAMDAASVRHLLADPEVRKQLRALLKQ